MGRWLASLCSEEKNTEKPLNRTDKTDKTLSGEVLSVLSVPSSGISEKFSAQATVRRPLPHELQKLPKGSFVGFVSDQGSRFSGIDRPPDPDEAEIEERKGMAADSVPEAYLDAWARLQCQRPRVPDDEWQLAINDAGGFLDAWGSIAAEFGWTSGELFDVPRGDGTSGLIWFLKGEPVRSLGPDHAVLGNGTHVFARVEHGEWIDRHAKGKR